MAGEKRLFELDLEEEDEMLDANIDEPIGFWANKQRELVTSVVDYNLSTLSSLIASDAIDLDPTFQRRLRWDDVRKSRLIESFLINVPVPPVFLNEDEYGKFSVIDGKQRLSTIHQFLTNNLQLTGITLFPDVNGMRLSDLPATLRNILRTRPTLRAVIILRQSDPDIKYEVFHRLNTGGAALNAQEIRNNVFHGRLNNLMVKLSETREVQQAFGIKNKAKSAMYQQMRDVELVLRFFTFKGNWDTFSGGMKRAMDSFMESHRDPDQAELQQLEASFMLALESVQAVFEGSAFHRWNESTGTWRRQVLAALFDAQMFALQYFDPFVVRPHKVAIVEGFKALFGNDEFRQSIDAATNTPRLFKKRIEKMKELVESIV